MAKTSREEPVSGYNPGPPAKKTKMKLSPMTHILPRDECSQAISSTLHDAIAHVVFARTQSYYALPGHLIIFKIG